MRSGLEMMRKLIPDYLCSRNINGNGKFYVLTKFMLSKINKWIRPCFASFQPVIHYRLCAALKLETELFIT